MNKIWILLACVSVLVFSGPVNGEDIPFSEPIDIKAYEDHYDLQKSVNIYIKENGTYTTETRIVTVSIAPQDYCYFEEKPLKDFFCDIMVSIVISTTDEETTKEFLSYLNFDAEEQTLFWDNAEYGNVDNAGDPFGEDNSLTVKDEYIEVTLTLMQFMPSEYLCGDCETDAAGYISFIDTVRFMVTIGYTQPQKDVIENMQDDTERAQDAQEYIITAQQYFQQQEYQKAQQEYQKAKDIFDEIEDTEKSDDMQEWITKCAAYDKAVDNFKEGTDLFEEAATTADYKEAINLYEDAKAYFQRAKTEFDQAEDTTQSEQCDTWIDRCDDEIDNLKDVGVLRGRLIYILVGIAVVGAIAAVVKQLTTEKTPKGKGKPGITLRARNTETNQEVSLDVQPTDKMGKVQQTAATKLGLIPSGVFYKGRPCPPDQTVAECGLANGSIVDIKPRSTSKPRESPAQNNQEKLARLEQQYREGKITKELYENLKKKLEK